MRRVVNEKTGESLFYNVEAPEEAVVVAFEQHDKYNFGVTKYPGYDKYAGLKRCGNIVRCGNWVSKRYINKWNNRIYFGCYVKVKHGPCRGFSGRVVKDCDSRVVYVDGVGYVRADYLKVVK